VTLERSGLTYDVVAAPDVPVRVNGRRAERSSLASGDLLEIGEKGTAFRFRLQQDELRPYKTVMEAFTDCVDCARYGAATPVRRAGVFTFSAARELVTQTRPLTRIALIAGALAVFAALGALVYRTSTLERRLEQEQLRLEQLEALLETGEGRTFSAADFAAARGELEQRIGESLSRIEKLETRSSARERVIAAAAPAVVFLQGAYGFVDPQSGRRLRFARSPADGQPHGATGGAGAGAMGEGDRAGGDAGDPEPGAAENRAADEGREAPASFFTLDGDGPPVEVLLTGTGFVVSDRGHVLTNRHVAVPWEFDDGARQVIAEGMAPVVTRFIAYLSGAERPLDARLVGASDEADVALLLIDGMESAAPELAPLKLADEPPDLGDELIVLGYPAGINALLARADRGYVERSFGGGTLDFWEVASVLARGGYIAPLATVGIAGQVTASSIVYDAETTHGGSGGPVLNLEGQVVAVNSAVLPQFGGSNLGVPAGFASRLLSEAGVVHGTATEP
jgi:S1-C subfamily serine protease